MLSAFLLRWHRVSRQRRSRWAYEHLSGRPAFEALILHWQDDDASVRCVPGAALAVAIPARAEHTLVVPRHDFPRDRHVGHLPPEFVVEALVIHPVRLVEHR